MSDMIVKTCKTFVPVGGAASFIGLATNDYGNLADALNIVYLILGIIGAIGTIALVWFGVWDRLKAKLKAAEDPSSPGGAKITPDEAEGIAKSTIADVKDAVGESEDAVKGIEKK